MSDKGKELYNKVKNKVDTTQEEGTLENKFGMFWKFASNMKFRQHDLRYLYEDSSREFVEKYRDQFIAMKEEFIQKMDFYVDKCIKVMREANNMTVYLAKTNEEAHDIFMKEIGEAKVIYKSKSNEAKDIGIIDVLKKNNIEIKETDPGVCPGV